MTKEEKSIAIENLTAQLAGVNVIYLADISGLNADSTTNLRRACFKAGIKLEVVKNTLLAKAMESSEINFGELPTVLKGNTSIMIADVASAPAKIIKDFRKKGLKPILKGAYITEDIYIGDENLDGLAAIKSRAEVLGEIIGLLQSPAQRVIAALQNQGKEEAAE
ncbi:50S ribosomal protein L10 [uncultured Flavobacterium sp.]|uniref:50S ribosomal protein L10 n=1 Tax=uncultured Flavobacterium sp. TaxID=165435 RepID=UPI0030EEC2F2|tara:strand:+ start:3532 stop:4026 length:495 start_codon:yes stop_codon:yes gene_type:complete